MQRWLTLVLNEMPGRKKINAKSLLTIIGACIKCGTEIELVCEGPDEEAALAHATELIESGLGE